MNPAKLDGSNGGRLRWVPSFLGPLSSTNITYPSGRTYAFNAALCESPDLDSDGDGLVNAIDPTPIFVGESIALSASMVHTPAPKVQFTWHSMAGCTNRLEYVSSPSATNWRMLTNIITGPTSGMLQAQDAMPVTGQRFYRVRIDMP